ncbi:MAG: TetR family transcriptional regulator [Chloroflexi bacterium]|nr:MAG: TetR family transcriptional regulator [Chloroflexota bacterium]
MKRTKEDAEKTRQTLLDAALAVFSSKGYQAARLQDIATAAGTTRGAIYHHFSNKAELYKALIRDASQQGNVAIQTAVSAGGSFTDIFQRIFTTTLQLLATDERFRQVTALSLYKTGISPELADLEAQRLQQADTLVAGIAATMQQGIANGEFRADISPETMARAFLSFQNGVAWLWLAGGQNFSLTDEASALSEILLHGMAAKV